MRTSTALAAAAGGGAAAAVLGPALRARPAPLVRTNVAGREVAATLGAPLGAAALAGAVIAVRAEPGRRPALVTAALAMAMGAAGLADDLRGPEEARGFRGHLAAAASGRLTGGMVKLIAGGLCGLAAGLATFRRPATVALTAVTVPLAANLVNLLDRAPGRAGKLCLVVGVPLVARGAPGWREVAGATLAGVAVCLPADLGERAMLGDAGANAAGAVLGLGVASSLPPRAAAAAAALLAGLNLASERWSFSALIERTRPLRALDRLGRRSLEPPPIVPTVAL